MTLAEIHAQLVHSTPAGWQEVDALADADGLLFDCPLCDGHKVLTFFPNAPAELVADPSDGKRWTPTGTGLADLSLSPSIALRSGCMWHGWVRDGAVTSV